MYEEAGRTVGVGKGVSGLLHSKSVMIGGDISEDGESIALVGSCNFTVSCTFASLALRSLEMSLALQDCVAKIPTLDTANTFGSSELLRTAFKSSYPGIAISP